MSCRRLPGAIAGGVVIVTSDAAFPVEDFLEAITSQLDRTQDALRLKAVTRPLTYAIRDFSMDLKVFVELAPDGKVMFRPSAADDTGSSVVHIGFTTVNRTMIEENTVSLSAVKSPSLAELGLDEQERRQLEKLGIRNASQLEQLKRTTSENTVARYSGLPVSRLRQALAQGRPSIKTVHPVTETTIQPAGGHPRVAGPNAKITNTITPPLLRADPVSAQEPNSSPPPLTGQKTPSSAAPARVRIPQNTRRIILGGPRIEETTEHARLAGRSLQMRTVDGGVEVDLGDDAADGPLELDLGDDGVVSMSLEFEPDDRGKATTDPWRTP